MKPNFSRGGSKPQMIPEGQSLTMTNLGVPKRGLYELSSTGKSLARLVELPHWLFDFASENRGVKTLLEFLVAREFEGANRKRDGESQGHIFLDPPQEFGIVPAVGVDEQIVKRDFWQKLELIFFNVYAPDYRLVKKWKINGEQFRSKSKPVKTSSVFEPQFMISLSELRRC